VGRVLVLADRLEAVAELGVLHRPAGGDGEGRQAEGGVVEGHLGEEVGHREPGHPEGREVGDEDALGSFAASRSWAVARMAWPVSVSSMNQ
jgi:hypothetical protein